MAQPVSALHRRPVYLVDGRRSPFLKARSTPGPFSPVDLAVACGRPFLLQQPVEPAAAIDEVILGCGAPLAEELNPARVAALRLGLGHRMPAWQVQRNCGSGLQAITSAAQAVADGHRDLVLAGGTDALSRVPLQFPDSFAAWLGGLQRARSPLAKLRHAARLRPRDLKPVIALLKGLTDPTVRLSMGQTAEVLAQRFAIHREAMDHFAAASHNHLEAAQDNATLADEIATAIDPKGRVFERDDGLRRGQTAAQLAKLRPAFEPPYGQVTAGNSSQVTDGAAWVLVASEDAVARHGLQPLARLVDYNWAGVDPAEMGLGPVHAATPLLTRHGHDLNDLAGWEINEAFAAQVLACLAAWADRAYCRDRLGLDDRLGDLDRSKLNVDGGAIALGHPVGASGTRIALHLAKHLQRAGGGRGMAALCIGGGQGGALLMESTAS